MCFSSGVRLVYEYKKAGTQCTPGDSTTRTAYTSTGAVCYKAKSVVGAGCESSQGTVYDAAGNEVAVTNTPFGSQPSVTCTGGASWFCGNPIGQPCDIDPFDACTPGSCPLVDCRGPRHCNGNGVST